MTIPHKESVLRHLERLSPEAEEIGAVNVIRFPGGASGHNTDREGFLDALRERRSLERE